MAAPSLAQGSGPLVQGAEEEVSQRKKSRLEVWESGD